MGKILNPYTNIGPGQIIKREMETLNWSQEDLSEIIGMSTKSISLIINNKQSITVETAILLSKAFNSSPEFWLNLEQSYRLRLKKEGKIEQETATKAEIRKYMPILDMKKKGWIDCGRSTESQIEAYCKFWNQKKPDFSVYSNEKLSFCTRRAKSDENYTKYYTLSWLHKANVESELIDIPVYEEIQLDKLSKHILEYTIQENGVSLFIDELNKTGVKFLVVSHLQKTYLDGASFFNKKNPVIVYTARYDRLDHFWWTISHEIAHILKHLKDADDCFLDNLDEKSDNNTKEKEADQIASNLLNVNELVKKAVPYQNYLSEQRLLEISKSCGLHPSVALGILQHRGLVDYRTLNRYKKTVMDLIQDKYKKG